jgi:hypothetical protein
MELQSPQVGGERLPQVPAARVTPPRQKTDDWALVIGPVSSLAEQVSNTDFVPAALRGKPAAVAAAILFGRELDMPPMQALNQVHVIDGRPSLTAEHKRAMVLEKGHLLTVVGDGGSATATGRRLLWRHPETGEPIYGEPSTVTWTLAMATVAGLTGKKNWQKHPRQMLKARATAELINDMFPDITHGLATSEEVQDEDAVPSSAPTPATEKVSRASKRVASRPAVGSGTAETPAPAATPTPDSVAPPEVPLPGEEEPAGQTPGEGLGNQSTSSPAGPSSREEYAERELAGADAVAFLTEPGTEPDEVYDAEIVDSEGDGSAEDVAATGSDESYLQGRFKQHMQEAQEQFGQAGGPVEENDPPLSAGKRRLLLAAFNALGVTDRAERLHTSSALLGRQVETWSTLTSGDGDKLIRAVNGLSTRDELEQLVQRAAAEWGGQT